MTTDLADPRRDSFGDEAQSDLAPVGQRGGCGQVAKGCGCALLVVLLVLLAVGIWIAISWKQWAVFVGRRMAEQAVASAPIAPADRERILEALDTLGQDFVAGRVSVEQMQDVIEALAEGPLLPLALVTAADGKYLQPSGLSPDEKAAGRRVLERTARAVVGRTLSSRDAESLMEPLRESGDTDDDSFTLKERLTDAELRDFLAEAKKRLDAAGVPDEPYEVDVAAEIDRAIRKAVGGKAEADDE